MSQVYLGNSGLVQLKRTSDESGFIAKVARSDINNQRNRFSYDYVGSLGGGLGSLDEDDQNTIEMQYVPLISGDRVRFLRVDRDSDNEWQPSTSNQNLLLNTPGTPDNDFVAFVNVDGMYGIRLYNNFEDAFNNNIDQALDLYESGDVPEVQYFRVIAGQSDIYRGFAGITNFEFTTSREAIDLTSLGKNYRRYYSNGLINGQGVLDCFWMRDDKCETALDQCESSRYIAELILRLEEGAVFSGKFVLDANPVVGVNRNPSVFYECNKCVLTSVAVTVEPSQMVRTRINFITSGPFSLRYQFLPAFLLTEGITREDDDSLLLQETEEGLELLDDGLD